MKEKKQINIQVGEKIKAARENAGYTQERLAELVDVSPQYLSDLERGVVGASLTTLKSLCETLNVSSDSLLFAEERQKNDLSEEMNRLENVPPKHFAIIKEIINKYLEGISLK